MAARPAVGERYELRKICRFSSLGLTILRRELVDTATGDRLKISSPAIAAEMLRLLEHVD